MRLLVDPFCGRNASVLSSQSAYSIANCDYGMTVDLEVKQKLWNVIESKRDETITFLTRLVQTPSITGCEGKCAEVCCEKIREIGLDVDMWNIDPDEIRKHPAYNDVIKFPPSNFPLTYEGRPNVVGIYHTRGQGKSIILNGHTDVVTPEPVARWTRDPWGGQVEDDKLYGRGACDMKGGLAAMIMAVQSILDIGLKPRGDVMLECVIEEEAGVGNGTLASLLRGYKADACIVTESSELAICPSMRAGLYWRITVEGKASHGVEKWKGVDAIQLGMKVLDSLKYLEASLSTIESHPLYEEYPILVPVTPDKIRAGLWKGMVAPQCVIEGYFEPLPGKPLEEWEKFFRDYVVNASKHDPWLRENPPKVEFTERYRGYELDIKSPFVQVLRDSYQDVKGGQAKVIGADGGCDAWMRSVYGGSSTVTFGPRGGNAHGADEFIYLDDLIATEKILAMTILEWCGYEVA
jgi:acetylornithine deacetylase